MSNDTPYKIRLEILHIAKQLLEEEHRYKCMKIDNDCQTDKENMIHEKTQERLSKQKEYPKYPTEEEIVAKAKTLNAFVSNRE